MLDLNSYLDQAKERSGSDYQTAKILGISRAQISNVRAGDSGLSDDACLLLADYIGADWPHVVAAANAHRTKSPALKARWERYAQASAIVVALTFSGFSPDANATGYVQAQSAGIYIMRSIRLWIRRLFRRPRFAPASSFAL